MKTAVISGITGGIGRALAEEMSSAGYVVIGLYNSDENGAAELRKKGFDCIKCDLSSAKEIADTSAIIIDKYHTIDALINNAGVSEIVEFSRQTDESIEKMLNVNLLGTMRLTKAFLPKMIENKYGRIVNISSIWGVFGASCESVYSASKAGLNGFTKALAKEVGISGITVNAIACGFIDTKMNSHLTSNERTEFFSSLAVPRAGKPSEPASLARYLCSDDAAYITAQIIGVDGGM